MPSRRVVVVRRIGEPVQVDSEALGLLTAAGLLPGQPARVRREGVAGDRLPGGRGGVLRGLAAARHRLPRVRAGHLRGPLRLTQACTERRRSGGSGTAMGHRGATTREACLVTGM